jgi:hypothetical protein
MKKVAAKRNRATKRNKLTSKAAVTAHSKAQALSPRKEIIMTKPTFRRLAKMTPDEIYAEFERVCAGIFSEEISMSEAIEHIVAWKQWDKWVDEQMDAELEMHREMDLLAEAFGGPKGTPKIDWLLEKGLLLETEPDIYEFSPKALAFLKCQDGEKISELAAEVRNAENADAQVRKPLDITKMMPDEIDAEIERVCAGIGEEISMSEAIEHMVAWKWNKWIDEQEGGLWEMDRLAEASGCPKGTPTIGWLLEKGLLLETSPDVYEFSPNVLALLKFPDRKMTLQ